MEGNEIFTRLELEQIRDKEPNLLVEIILKLQQSVEQRSKEVSRLQEQLEQLTREQHRQAAPFRIPERKKKILPQKPGNKPGHKGAYRKIAPQDIDEHIEVTLEQCPKCGGALKHIKPIDQVIEDLPEIIPHITGLRTYSGKCAKCGVVRSTHPIQVSKASGAAGTHLGSKALAVCTQLQYRYGLTKRKVQHLLKDLFHLRLTPGGVVHTAHRLAQKLSQPFKELHDQLKQSELIHSDETSWYVGQPKSWLWVFTNSDTTMYLVRNTRSKEVIKEAIGENYEGVLISDCLNIYDNVNAIQQKCYSHHLKAISQALEAKAGSNDYLQQLRQLLKVAMIVKSIKQEVDGEKYKSHCERLEQQADRLLVPARADPIEEKIANRLRKQRDHLFTFLYHDRVDATNNLAERQLRPAVIARKVSCGNKTDKGALTWQILSSFAATYVQRKLSFGELIQSTVLLNPPATAQER